MTSNLEHIFGNQAKASIEQEIRSCKTCQYDGGLAICQFCCQLSEWKRGEAVMQHEQGLAHVASKVPDKDTSPIRCVSCEGYCNYTPSSRMGDGYSNQEAVSSICEVDNKPTEVIQVKGEDDQPPPSKTLRCDHCGAYLDMSTGMPSDTAEYHEILRLNKALDNLSAQHAELLEKYEELLTRFVEETTR